MTKLTAGCDPNEPIGTVIGVEEVGVTIVATREVDGAIETCKGKPLGSRNNPRRNSEFYSKLRIFCGILYVR